MNNHGTYISGENVIVFSCYFTMFYRLDTIPLTILFYVNILHEINIRNGGLIRLRIILFKLASFRYDRMEEESLNDEFGSRDKQKQQKEKGPIRDFSLFFFVMISSILLFLYPFASKEKVNYFTGENPILFQGKQEGNALSMENDRSTFLLNF